MITCLSFMGINDLFINMWSDSTFYEPVAEVLQT